MNEKHLYARLLLLIIFLLNVMIANGQTRFQLKEITQQLETIYTLDQGVRQKLQEVQMSHGHGSEEYRQSLEEMRIQDSINRHTVFEIIDKYGWISKSVSSENASNAIFYVIQHSELDTQLKYKKLVQKAFEDKEISDFEYVIFEDRLNTRQGKYQLYGTQSAVDNIGNSYLYPLSNIDSTDIRRSKVGLPNLSEQIERSKIKYPFPAETVTPSEIVLIGHFWKEPNIGIDNISVWDGDKHIGKTDSNGFFYIKYSFFNREVMKLTFKDREEIVGETSLNKGKDFYEIYSSLKH